MSGSAFDRVAGVAAFLVAAGAFVYAILFIYIGRLSDFIQPGDYLSLVPPIAYGFAFHPAFYLWLGWILWNAGERRG